jgi:hypothetical protein
VKIVSRAILIALTALVAVLLYAPAGHVDFTGAWLDATYGVQPPHSRVSSHVAGVIAGSPAARAGIRPGDKLIAPSFSDAFTRLVFPHVGETDRFTLARADGARYEVTLRAQPIAGVTAMQRWLGIAALLPATIFIAIAFVLVYMRPSVMTWSFFAYAAGYISTAPAFAFFHSFLPNGIYWALTFVLSTLLGNFAVLALLPFIVRFPDDRLTGVRKVFDRALWVAIALAFAAYSVQWYQTSGLHRPTLFAGVLDEWLPLATFAFATLALIKKYNSADPAQRQRFGFLILGTIVSFIAYAIYFVPWISPEVAQIAGGAVVIMPICVMYAVLRHRVLDLNFVLNRALAYSILSLLVLALVSVLDWSAGHLISEGRFATWLELGITIGVGFLLDRINRVISSVVEGVFFRRRREAERLLRSVASALPYATTDDAVDDALVRIPAEALSIASAALYRRSQDGLRYEGGSTAASTTIAPPGFDRNHLLVRILQAQEQPVWLDDVRSSLDPQNASIYSLAMPVMVRHELVSIVLYGTHFNGSQIDPEELALLTDLAREAARAYDHIEAVRIRKRYALTG